MSTEENVAIIRRWLDEGWTKGNLAVANELIDPGSRRTTFHRV